MTSINSQCLVCANFTEGGKYTCTAFPDGIAEDILLNKLDHRDPIEGDQDIQWRPNEVGDKHPLAGLDG